MSLPELFLSSTYLRSSAASGDWKRTGDMSTHACRPTARAQRSARPLCAPGAGPAAAGARRSAVPGRGVSRLPAQQPGARTARGPAELPSHCARGDGRDREGRERKAYRKRAETRRRAKSYVSWTVPDPNSAAALFPDPASHIQSTSLCSGLCRRHRTGSIKP